MISKALFSSASGEWETPQKVFDYYHARYNFTLDPCATPENAMCPTFFTKEADGLRQSWSHHRVWCNPPYGRGIGAWVEKAHYHKEWGGLAVLLLPARTDTQWFHKYIWAVSRPYDGIRVELLQGRLKFGGAKNSAPFPSVVVIFSGR